MMPVNQTRRVAAMRLGSSSTTTPAMSSCAEDAEAAPPLPAWDPLVAGRAENSLLEKVSVRLSGAKNESWNKPESCHSVARSWRLDAVDADRSSRVRWMLREGAGCGPRAVPLACGTSSCSSGIEGRWSTGERR